MAQPTAAHSQAASHVLWYIKGTLGSGIFFSAKGSLQLKAFNDSNWASCRDSHRSITGFSIYLGHSIISWRSKKQSTVSRSSSEAEYRALASTTCELQWLTYLLQDFCISFVQLALLYCDNNSAIQIASNQVFHECTKHIDLDFHIVREKVQRGLIKLLPVSSSMQLADIFTKALPPSMFKNLCSKLGMLNIHSQHAGDS